MKEHEKVFTLIKY